jgi:phage baseplate assembly protein W
MALIKLTDTAASELDNSSLNHGYLYKDLFLDLETSVYYNKQLNKSSILKDVQGVFDENAVRNSITNIFLTAPGQKILSPEFGLDLRRFLFEPISEFNAFAIKDDIRNRLPLMEPRIEVDGVSVIPNADMNEYEINMQINIPSLNVYGISLRSTLNNNGYFIF